MQGYFIVLSNVFNILKIRVESYEACYSLSQSMSKIFVCPKIDENQCFFKNIPRWPIFTSIIHSCQFLFGQFFLYMTHMDAFYLSPSFYSKWTKISQSKSSETCNFKFVLNRKFKLSTLTTFHFLSNF